MKPEIPSRRHIRALIGIIRYGEHSVLGSLCHDEFITRDRGTRNHLDHGKSSNLTSRKLTLMVSPTAYKVLVRDILASNSSWSSILLILFQPF